MDENLELQDKIKALTFQLSQRDSQIEGLKKVISSLRNSTPIAETISTEKEIQKRINEEVDKREKRFLEKLNEQKTKYEKELTTSKHMYETLLNKVENAIAQERTIEAMSKDIKILEDEKRNMKLMHMEILKQNQIEFEIKHAEAKKKMIEEIKKVQHNVSVNYLEQMNNSQKLTFLRNNQLEKEIDYRSVRLEELYLKIEKFEKRNFALQQELDNSKYILENIVEKNKCMREFITKLINIHVKTEQNRELEIDKMLIFCGIEPQNFYRISKIFDKNYNVKNDIPSNNFNSSNTFRSKKSKFKSMRSKSPKKTNNILIHSNSNENVNINMRENQHMDNSNNKYNNEIKLRPAINEEYLDNQENEIESCLTNNNEDKIITINPVPIGNYSENKINLFNEILNKSDVSCNKLSLLKNTDDEKHQNKHSESIINQKIAHELDIQSQQNNHQYDNSKEKDKNKSFINKDSFSKEIKPLNLSIVKDQKYQKLSQLNINNCTNFNFLNNDFPINMNGSYGQIDNLNHRRDNSSKNVNNNSSTIVHNNIKSLKNKNYMSAENFLDKIILNNNSSNIHSNIDCSSLKNANNNLNLFMNKTSSNWNSCSKATGFARDNNFYQQYETKIKSLESALKQKETEFSKIKITFENLNNKLTAYERKFSGIISLYEVGLKKLAEEEEKLKQFKYVDFNFDFQVLKNYEFNKLSAENKYSILLILLNQLIPMININDLESDFIKQNIALVKLKYFEEKLKNTTQIDSGFRNSVKNFVNVKNIKIGKGQSSSNFNNPLKNFNNSNNINSVGNVFSKFKAPLNYLKEEKFNLNRKLNAYDFQYDD